MIPTLLAITGAILLLAACVDAYANARRGRDWPLSLSTVATLFVSIVTLAMAYFAKVAPAQAHVAVGLGLMLGAVLMLFDLDAGKGKIRWLPALHIVISLVNGGFLLLMGSPS